MEEPGIGAAAPALPLPVRRTTGSVDAPRRGRVHAAIVTVRPRQWIKNLLVIAAAGAAGALGRDDVPGRVALAFVGFCALASGIYAINDVCDAEEDRGHPRKRLRPVAAGQLSPRSATTTGFTLIAIGLVLCAEIRPVLGLVALAYVGLTISYTLIWRRLLLFDIIAIAGGFVLRAIAGGAAAKVELSHWFLLVVSCAALLVAAGKRSAELARAGSRGPRRDVLKRYTEGRLSLVMMLSAGGALFAYAMWAFELPSAGGFPWRPVTIIPFAFCLVRYRSLVRAGDGEAPEDLLLKDPSLMLAAVTWLVLFALGVHAAT